MRAAIALAFAAVGLPILGFAPGAFAFDLETHRTEFKTAGHVQPNRGAMDGREGGETMGTAFPIPALPFSDAGATCDNMNDYDEACPYEQSFSPDVVYVWTPPSAEGPIRIDLCGSSYDTKVYVYENSYTPGSPYACNDDYYYSDECGMYVSCIESMEISQGATYYIVIDGYMGDCGAYELTVTGVDICPVTCTGVPEGEPTLVNEYVDTYNGGCSSDPVVFQTLWGGPGNCLNFCGVSGWYAFQGMDFRDTDWFIVTASGASVDWIVETECPVLMCVLVPDCASGTILYSTDAYPCLPGQLTFPTTPGAACWLWIGPSTFTPPSQPSEFDYVMDICGIESEATATETTTWGEVKNLFR
jgi:hypothetical protein